MSQIETKRCTLRLATGVIEACRTELCAFWEPGGAVVEGGCLIERLGVDVRRADLAEYLLETQSPARCHRGGIAPRKVAPALSATRIRPAVALRMTD